MKHNVDHLSSLLDRKLTEMKEKNNGTLANVNDAFIYAFGSFMSMEPGFEIECDEIAKYSDVMRVFQYAAYLIRKITGGVSYRDAKTTIKDFIATVDDTFPKETHQRINEALIEFAVSYMKSLRDEQGTNLESFITNSAPIVPYEGMPKKQPLEPGIETRIDCADAVQKVIVDANQTRSGNNDTLMTILLNNLAGIMQWKDLTTMIEDPVTGANNLLELDHLIIDRGDIPYAVRGYYFLATINYYGLPIEIFDKYLKFFRSAGDFSKPQSYDAFEAMVDAMAETVNPNIAMESWDDPEMERRANELYEKALNSGTITVTDSVPKHDLNAFANFIAQNHSMKFDEWSKRLFVTSLRDRKIVNVNHFMENSTIYELDNGVMVCPFVDVLDNKVHLLIQGEKSSKMDVCLLSGTDFETLCL